MNTKKKSSKRKIFILSAVLATLAITSGMYTGRLIKNNTAKQQQVQQEITSIAELKPVPENKDGGYETSDIYEMVNPSVVNINVYGSHSISPIGSGTGIVMTQNGYIVTNAHVVNGGTSVNVIFDDGTNSRGEIIGQDKTTDIAVVKVDRNDLKAAEFGDSSQLKPGERVVAIGNAGGLSNTITQGVISGLNRDLGEGARSIRLIQVDAAINPGNSGGPLINRYGQVIGINSSKIADVDFEGIGFAIPIKEAMPIIESIINHGYVKGRAVLGVSVVQLNNSNGPINGLPSAGIYISDISPESDLLNRGVRTRDVIISANSRKLLTTDDLLEELDKFSPGDKIRLEIFRPETGETFEVDVVLLEAVE